MLLDVPISLCHLLFITVVCLTQINDFTLVLMSNLYNWPNTQGSGTGSGSRGTTERESLSYTIQTKYPGSVSRSLVAAAEQELWQVKHKVVALNNGLFLRLERVILWKICAKKLWLSVEVPHQEMLRSPLVASSLAGAVLEAITRSPLYQRRCIVYVSEAADTLNDRCLNCAVTCLCAPACQLPVMLYLFGCVCVCIFPVCLLVCAVTASWSWLHISSLKLSPFGRKRIQMLWFLRGTYRDLKSNCRIHPQRDSETGRSFLRGSFLVVCPSPASRHPQDSSHPQPGQTICQAAPVSSHFMSWCNIHDTLLNST